MGDARLTAEQETMLREAVRRRAGEAPMFAGLVEAVWAELDRVRRSLDEARAQLTAQRNRNDALQELLDVGAKTMEAVNGQLAAAQAENGRLRGLVKRFVPFVLPGVSNRADAFAEMFYRETGVMAPGKSVPLPMEQPEDDERRERYRHWSTAMMGALYIEARAALADAGKGEG